MAIKDLFSKEFSEKVLPSVSMDEAGGEVESAEYIKKEVESKNRFYPHVDYSEPRNFAKFGLAEQYYEDAINYILNDYPYDGSLREKVEWELSASYLDKHIFENEYPRTNGYANFGRNYGSLSSASNGYSLYSSGDYIFLKGGPNSASQGMKGTPLYQTFTDSNIYHTGSERKSNLEINGNQGITVEFWLKKNGYTSGSEAGKQVVCDIWNSGSHGTSGYGRFRLELHPGFTGEQDKFYVELQSGSSGLSAGQSFNVVPIGSGLNITGSGWHQFSLSVINSGSNMVAQLYASGTLNQTIVTGSSIGTITGSMLGTIGALINTVSGTGGGGRGYAKLSGSLDEFRFWKIRRSAKQIGRYWFSQVGAGTNTDDSNTTLGVYYKFNEGILSTSSVDARDTNVLDYSGRVSNGKWIGYVSGSRSTGSAMVESGVSDFEFLDPILYSDHPDVAALSLVKQEIGFAHDSTNNATLYNSFPEWITTQDEEKNHHVLRKVSQVMASYLDNVYLQIEALPKLKDPSYVTGSSKPYPFVSRFLESAGMIAPEIFTDAQELEAIASRDDFREFTEKISDVKNKIYQNVYNNLVYIYKSKGTEKSFRNLIRCFGVDDELIKINLYGDNITYDFQDNYRYVAETKKFADFNDVDRFDATVYQHTSSAPSSLSYISASVNSIYHGRTFECEAIFPKKFDKDSQLYFDTPFLTSSLFGCHTVTSFSNTDKTWGSPDHANFQVYAVKSYSESKDASFVLNGTAGSFLPTLTSSIFRDVYDNKRWSFSVRLKPDSYPFADGVTGSAGSSYTLYFAGYNTFDDVISDSFIVSASVPFVSASAFISGSKRFFVGSHRTNFTGSVLSYSDAKLSNMRVWMKYLSDDDLLSHARDAMNYGTSHPGRNAWITEYSKSFGNNVIQVPEMETLVLHWTFENVTGSGNSSDGLATTSDAKFIVEDVSSGSLDLTGRYDWLGTVRYHQYPGQGDFYLPYDDNAINNEYVPSAKQVPPEVLNSSNMIEIRTDDDVLFTRESRPIKHFYSVEKSPYGIISEEIIKLFGTIKDFNNLVGEPVNRYRQDYKALEKLRHLYFERIENSTIDFEKFVDYFKWFDSSISLMLQQLVPASANFSDEIRTIIESHVLERNKYWNKFPTVEFKRGDPEGGIKGINELLYDWMSGSAPVPLTQSQHGFWWQNRAEKTGRNSSGNTAVDTSRTSIFNVRLNALNRSFTTPVVLNVSQQVSASDTIREPLKIRNIRNDLSLHFISASVLNANVPLGNYAHDYEIVQTSGRRINNKFLTRTNGTQSLTLQTPVLTGSAFDLPNRDAYNSKHVFVERFSTPGESRTMSRGYLDREAEEYSVYNSINFRNNTVRLPLNVSESTHTAQFGLNPNNSSIANFHKINRNPYKRIEMSGSTFVTSSIYDNAFIRHAIPQSELQYAWITASADVSQSPLGLLSEFYVPSGSSSVAGPDIVFVTSSFVKAGGIAVDFVGLNTLIYDPVTSSLNLLSSSTGRYRNNLFGSVAVHEILNSLLLHRNGGYQYPTWKQIRTGENQIVRAHRKENTISVIDSPIERKFVTNSGVKINYLDSRPNTFTNYHEPAVIFKNKPMIHTLNVKGSTNPISISHTYANNISMFSNTELNNRLGLGRCDDQMYDRIKEMYIDADENELENPVQGLLGLSYREIIYPKEVNTGKITIRGRVNYAENAPVSGTVVYGFYNPGSQTRVTESIAVGDYTSNGIDRGPLDRRTFWRRNPRDRNRWGLITSFEATDYTTVATNIVYSGSTTTPLINSMGILDGDSPSVWPFGTNLGHTQSHDIIEDYDSFDMGQWPGLDFGEMAPYRGFIGFSASPSPFGNSAWAHSNDYQYMQNGTSVQFGSGSARYYFLHPTCSTTYTKQVFPDQQIFLSYHAETDDEIFTHRQDDFNHRFRVPYFSGKDPWYDSYEEYFSDIRPMAKEYTVIPEFNISDQMNFYVKQKGGNFRVQNDKYLTLDGGYITQSAESETSGFNENFFKEFSHSDFMKYFDVLMNDHDNIDTHVENIKLTCRGIKKLLPYNGFYPVTRTLQLATLFSQSYAPYIGGFKWANGHRADLPPGQPDSGTLATMALMQPFFAPGIMFNTIKAGIAMDYAVITGSFFDASAGGTNTVSINTATNYRLQFETLLDLKNGSGVGGVPLSQSDGSKRIYWMGPEYLASVALDEDENRRDLFFDWNGGEDSPLYRLGMHNFLAESINFFLLDNNIKNITSRPANKMKSMVSGNTYYMDVSLYRSDDILMYGGRWNTTHKLFHSASSKTGTTVSTATLVPDYAALTFTGKFFGSPFVYSNDGIIYSGGIRTLGYTGGGIGSSHRRIVTYADGAYAAHLPPYHFKKSIARISYRSDGTEKSNSDPVSYVLSKTQVDHQNDMLKQHINFYLTASGDPSVKMPSWQSRSTVTSSVNLFGVSKGLKVTYDGKSSDPTTGKSVANSIEDTDATFNSWVISPKYECPILNFANQPEELYTVVFDNGSSQGVPAAPLSGAQHPIPKGMWSGYGNFCSGTTGIFLSVGESFPDLNPDQRLYTGSLVDVFGFDTSPQRLGEVAYSKEISEAIVAIPFVDNVIKDNNFANTVTVAGRNFFEIERKEFDVQKKRVETGTPAVPRNAEFGDIEVSETSISKLSQQMRQYIIPPEMNFLKYDDISPFVMYVFEFKHLLDRQDLADIWQGVMPRIAMTAEKDEVEVSHPMRPWEFFHGKKLPSGIRWLVFKVKKQAAINYFSKTADSKDDDRFKFEFKVGTKPPEYSFNWPYDYFSLVELAQLEAEVGIGPVSQDTPKPINVPGIGDINKNTSNSVRGVLPTQQIGSTSGKTALINSVTTPPVPKVSVFGRFSSTVPGSKSPVVPPPPSRGGGFGRGGGFNF